MYKKNNNGGGLVVNIQDIKDILGLIISLSSVLGIFTGIVNKLFNNKLKPVYERLKEDEDKALKQEMDTCRFRVVTFAGELRRGVKHTRYEFDIIARFANRYDECVEKLGIVNHLFDTEIQYINECYKKLDE